MAFSPHSAKISSWTIERDRLTAVDEQSGERFIVRHGRDDFYDAVVELAQQV